MLDVVVNHCSPQYPFVSDSKYNGWFHENKAILNYDNQQECENGWLSNLPDFNHENPETKKYLIDMAKWWIGETKVDGFRLDTEKHV